MTLIIPRRKLLIGMGAALCAPAIVRAQVPMTGAGLGTAAVTASGSAWDSAGKGTVLTLSQTTIPNDTVANSTGASWGTVRGTQGYVLGSSNKVCFDLVFTAGSTSNLLVGFCDATTAGGIGLNNFLGSFNDSAGNLESGGQGFAQSVGSNWTNSINASAGWGPLVTNDTVRVALDCANKFGYLNVKGTWLTFGGSVGDPTSGVSGTGKAFAWTSGTQTVFPGVSLDLTTDGSMTIKTTGLAGKPAGYSDWG